ncbi:MAG: hypothetical protein GTO45_23185, partial [Candidatus Aminicenantes bacterium]|nr:hypothetical protein [Candidatus Aminicenantes bacterium]NIN87668.1 hypothetical protein [Candidatus Aminicenantes bacterium]
DHIGEARVQAWDGTTKQEWGTPVPVQDEPEWDFVVVDFYSEDTMTVGWSFDVNQDCRIEEFALYRYSPGLTWQDVDAIRV